MNFPRRVTFLWPKVHRLNLRNREVSLPSPKFGACLQVKKTNKQKTRDVSEMNGKSQVQWNPNACECTLNEHTRPHSNPPSPSNGNYARSMRSRAWSSGLEYLVERAAECRGRLGTLGGMSFFFFPSPGDVNKATLAVPQVWACCKRLLVGTQGSISTLKFTNRELRELQGPL